MKNQEKEYGGEEPEKLEPLMDMEIKEKSECETAQRTQDLSHRMRLLRTIWFGVTFVILGMIVGQNGPAFLDLQLIAQVGTDIASAFFTAWSFGVMAGATLGGHLLGRVSTDLMQLVTFSLPGVITIIYPWSRHFPIMVALSFLNSMLLGSFDATCNSATLAMWGEESGSPMQVLHFCFAIGGVFSPLYIRPFLALRLNDTVLGPNRTCFSKEETPVPCSSLTGEWINATNTADVNQNSTDKEIIRYGETRIYYAYLITGCITLLGAFPYLMFYLKDRSSRKKKQIPTSAPRTSDLPRKHLILTVALLCSYYFLYNAIEDCFFSYLFTVVVKQLSWQKTEAAALTSAFWAAFSTTRFCGIFIGRKLKAITMLLIFIPMMAVSMLGFLLSAHYECFSCVWVATIAIGISMSVVFPTGLVFAEQNMTVVNGRVMSAVFIALSIGTMTNPLLLGTLMERYTYMWFSYLLLAETLLLNVVLVVLILYSRLKLCKVRENNRQGQQTLTVTVKDPSEEPLSPEKTVDELAGTILDADGESFKIKFTPSGDETANNDTSLSTKDSVRVNAADSQENRGDGESRQDTATL